MSVIIQGMSMPENCAGCALYIEGACYATGVREEIRCPEKGRPSDCELVEFRESGGRRNDEQRSDRAE